MMTTPWNPDGIWKGATVAVLAPGPDMTEALALTVKKHKTIAVNRAVLFAPWANMFVALDPPNLPFWEDADKLGFAGIRVVGVPCDIDAMYAGMFYENAPMQHGEVLEIRNNGLAALRIAFRSGAAKILLVGFDSEKYDGIHAHTGFRGLKQGLDHIVSEIRAAGVTVEYVKKSVAKLA